MEALMNNRIAYLDGVRGLAILLVVLFHTYAIHPEMPYSDQFFEIWLFKYGWIGVELFFLLSGFVILMTLERSKSFYEFIFKRWLRLFPAMLLVCIFLYATAGFFPERYGGQPELSSLVPSLTFINPYILNKIIPYSFVNLEGSFWSLYVEVAFYIIVGLIYFKYSNRNCLKTIYALLACHFLAVILDLLNTWMIDLRLLRNIVKITNAVGLLYFGWFSIGMMLYQFREEHKRSVRVWIFVLLLISSIITGYITRNTLDAMVALFVITLIFPLILWSKVLQRCLEQPFWIFLGFISYPLYLIHERTIVSATVALAKIYPSIPPYILPIIPVIILVLISWVIAKFLEIPLRNFLKEQLINFFHMYRNRKVK